MNLIVFLLLNIAIVPIWASIPCNPRVVETGIVCVCDSEYCDTIDPISPLPKGQYALYTSNKEGLRFERTVLDFAEPESNGTRVDRSVQYQKIIGFGGAFTDSTGINVNSLDSVTRTHLLRSYFAEDGLEYNVGRVPIGGTDFSTFGYSYLDSQENTYNNERNYSLVFEDFEYKIPLIKEAKEMATEPLELFASAWTAPKAWKTNGKYAGYGLLIEEFYQAWADYFIRFLDLYKEEGLSFWGLTTGNEPLTGLLEFTLIPSVGWFPKEQSLWIRENLGPTLRNSDHSNLLLFGHDDQRFVVEAFEQVLTDNETASYLDGMALHWYWDKIAPPSVVSNFHDKHPDKLIFATEACRGNIALEAAVELGSWLRGQHYAEDIMEDLQHWVSGWTDWNMALDMTGGPTYILNNVDSPIIVNAEAGEFYKQPMYYALGHFTKFLPRNSVRIGIADKQDGLILVAFERPDEGTAIIIVNTHTYEIPIEIVDEERGSIKATISAKSFTSIVYW